MKAKAIGKRKVQLSISESDYQRIRKAAYERETTVNKVIVKLAIEQLERLKM